jgi:hypothetical protein
MPAGQKPCGRFNKRRGVMKTTLILALGFSIESGRDASVRIAATNGRWIRRALSALDQKVLQAHYRLSP